MLPSRDLVELAGCEQLTLYLDVDGDGYGDPSSAVSACVAPDSAVENALDCDDADPDQSPSAAPICSDGLDNDCDGAPDCDSMAGHSYLDEASAVMIDQFEAGAGCGIAITDLTGDGVMDLILGSPGANEGDQNGRTYLVAGPVRGEIDLTSNDVPDISVDGINLDGYILTTGDLNADGYVDLALSVGSSEREENAVFMVPGPVLEDYEVDRDGATTLHLPFSTTDYYREALIQSGDVLHADGQTDLMVDSRRANGGAGSVFFIPGPISQDGSIFDLAETALHATSEETEEAINNVNIVGDLDGDGFADVAGMDYGILYLVFDLPPGLMDLADIVDVTINAERTGLGQQFVNPGDVDGDGLDDLLTTATYPYEVYWGGGETVYLYSSGTLNAAVGGPVLDFEADNTAVFEGNGNSQIGMAIASPGDLNGDGFSDVFLGDPRCAYGDDDRYKGLAALWYGPVEGTVETGSGDIVIEGAAIGSRTGWRVAASPRDAVNNAILLVGAWPLDAETTMYQFTPDGY